MATIRTLVDEAGIAALIDDVVEKLVPYLKSSSVFVGIREGGDVLAIRLAEKIRNHGLEIDAVGALDITLYRDDFGHRQHWPDVRASDISFSLDGKLVVLVDDVIFTGRTIRAALEALLDYGRPERVLLVALIDRGYRQLPIQPDIVGKVLDLERDALCLVQFREQNFERDSVVLSEGP